MLMLGFYHNFSIISLKKISRKIFAMLSKTQCIFITEQYLHSHSFKTTRNEFKTAFNGVQPPNQSTISRLVGKFRESGNVYDRIRIHQRKSLTPEKIAAVKSTIESNRSILVRKLEYE